MKKLISKEIANEVQDVYLHSKNWTLTEYEFMNVSTFAIGYVKVVKHGQSCLLELAPEANKAYMTEWRKDVGGLMAKDFRKNISSGKYFEFKTSATKTLLRKADDDEVKALKEADLLHVKFGDFYYTIMIHTALEGSYLFASHCHDDELPEKEEDPEDDYVYTEEPELESVSLFE